MAPGEEEDEAWPPEDDELPEDEEFPEDELAEEERHAPEVEFVNDEFAGVRQRPVVDLDPKDGEHIPQKESLWEIKERKPRGRR